MSEGERVSLDEAIRLRRWLSGDSDSTLELNWVANLTTAGNMVIYDVQGAMSAVIVNSFVFQTTMNIWNFPAEEVPAIVPDPLVTPRNRLLKLCGVSGLTKGSAVFVPTEGAAQTVDAFREKVLAGLENKELAPEPSTAPTARLSYAGALRGPEESVVSSEAQKLMIDQLDALQLGVQEIKEQGTNWNQQLLERLDRLEGMLQRLTPAALIRANAGLAVAPAEDDAAME